jgi:hypothetical protein
MKKYRLTRIKVKTREIISISKAPPAEPPPAVCPVCRTILTIPQPAAETAAEIAPAQDSENRNPEDPSNQGEQT